jgi:hypothetical protein
MTSKFWIVSVFVIRTYKHYFVLRVCVRLSPTACKIWQLWFQRLLGFTIRPIAKENFARQPSWYFKCSKNITSTKVLYFSKFCYHTFSEDLRMSDTSVLPASQVCVEAGNWKIRRRGILQRHKVHTKFCEINLFRTLNWQVRTQNYDIKSLLYPYCGGK